MTTRNEKKEVVFVVTVPEGASAQEMLEKTGRAVYFDERGVKFPEQTRSGKRRVVFFNPDKVLDVGGEGLKDEFAKRRLVPDFFFQAKVNELHPEFADDHPNVVSWPGERGWDYYAHFGSDEHRRHSVAVRSSNPYNGDRVNGNEGVFGEVWYAGISR